jgi:hypothetical protein
MAVMTVPEAARAMKLRREREAWTSGDGLDMTTSGTPGYASFAGLDRWKACAR